MSIILCDFFVLILILYIKTIIFQNNLQSFYFILNILFEILSDSSSANKLNINSLVIANCTKKLEFFTLLPSTIIIFNCINNCL